LDFGFGLGFDFVGFGLGFVFVGMVGLEKLLDW